MANTKIKDIEHELRIYRSRIFVAALFVLFLTGILVVRYAYLQIDRYSEYRTEAEQNRIVTEPVAPSRGLVATRDGTLIAKSRPSYLVSIIPEQVDDLEETLDELGQLFEVTEQQRARFLRRTQQSRRPHSPVNLRYELTEEEVAKVVVQQHRLVGVEVSAQSVRYYPYGELFAHTLGYVGRINESELQNLDSERYAGTSAIGKTGIEKTWEEVLMGFPGQRQVEVNARGRALRTLNTEQPTTGGELILTLDMKVQETAATALEGRRGSAVAIDVNTGEVLALVSTPTFDPNLFVTGISHTNYRALIEDLDSPMFNRAIQARYPPGSTVKPEIGLAALHYNLIDPNTTINDPGYFSLPNDEHRYRDWKREGHGPMNFYQAMAQSCDTYYYELAHEMGIDRYSEFLAHFGFGERTGIDLPQERSGILPSREWKRNARNRAWYPGDTINAGIGQGFFLATPIQLAHATSVVATRGYRYRPHLVREIRGSENRSIEPELIEYFEVDDNDWEVLHQSMREVVHNIRGTAHLLSRNSAYEMAGKSGTAQVVGIAQGEKYDADALSERLRDHALFVSFAPYDNPQVAVAVIVENGEGGSTVAGPIAKQIMDAWLLDESGQLKQEYRNDGS